MISHSINQAYIQLSLEDNVGVATRALIKGEILNAKIDLRAATDIPSMHKVALRDIAAGQEIKKYQQIIGLASKAIKAGEHIHSHNCSVGKFTTNYQYSTDLKNIHEPPAHPQRTFLGYKRNSGKSGTRNYIGILTSVNCSATVARQIADHYKYGGKLDAYPNVDGVVALVHGTGCGMRNSGDGYDNLQRILSGYATHPNFGAVLIIGLGCEVMQIPNLMAKNELHGAENLIPLTIQDHGGSRKTIEAGIAEIDAILPSINQAQRQPIPISEIKLALQCGGSDAYSGITANPALGKAADILVAHGGTAILSETTELYGAEHLLTRRAINQTVGEALIERIRWWEDYTRNNGDEIDNNPSPGNKAGGLTTILEKSLGAMAKGGTSNLNGVFRYAEPIDTHGLVIMDSPGFDPVSATGQVASGANIICFTTGRGSTFGFKPVPTIKLATNSRLYQNMEEDMDINCGPIIDGQSTVEKIGHEIFEEIIAVASVQKTKSEILGYGDNEFTPWQLGSTV